MDAGAQEEVSSGDARGTPRARRLTPHGRRRRPIAPLPLVVGANQRSSSLAVRDRLYVEDARAPAVPRGAAAGGHRAGAAGLDLRPGRGAGDARRPGQPRSRKIAAILARHGGYDAGEIADQLYVLTGEAALRHLFAVGVLARKHGDRRTARPRPGQGELSRIARGRPHRQRAGGGRPMCLRRRQAGAHRDGDRRGPGVGRGGGDRPRARRPRRPRTPVVPDDRHRRDGRAAGRGAARGRTGPAVRHRHAGGARRGRGARARLPHAAARGAGGRRGPRRYHPRLSRQPDAGGHQRDGPRGAAAGAATGRSCWSTRRCPATSTRLPTGSTACFSTPSTIWNGWRATAARLARAKSRSARRIIDEEVAAFLLARAERAAVPALARLREPLRERPRAGAGRCRRRRGEGDAAAGQPAAARSDHGGCARSPGAASDADRRAVAHRGHAEAIVRPRRRGY